VTGRQLLIHAYGDARTVVAAALRSAQCAAAELGSDVAIHVVAQGPAVRALADDSTLSDVLGVTPHDPRVVILACQNSLRSAGLTTADLRADVQHIPSAVAYLAERQWKGSAYVRV
jgi:intracellular sulfur oxidation DsrE/DsrF family protein